MVDGGHLFQAGDLCDLLGHDVATEFGEVVAA